MILVANGDIPCTKQSCHTRTCQLAHPLVHLVETYPVKILEGKEKVKESAYLMDTYSKLENLPCI